MRTLRSKSEGLLQSIAKPFGLFGSLLAIVSHIDEGVGDNVSCDMSRQLRVALSCRSQCGRISQPNITFDRSIVDGASETLAPVPGISGMLVSCNIVSCTAVIFSLC